MPQQGAVPAKYRKTKTMISRACGCIILPCLLNFRTAMRVGVSLRQLHIRVYEFASVLHRKFAEKSIGKCSKQMWPDHQSWCWSLSPRFTQEARRKKGLNNLKSNFVCTDLSADSSMCGIGVRTHPCCCVHLLAKIRYTAQQNGSESAMHIPEHSCACACCVNLPAQYW